MTRNADVQAMITQIDEHLASHPGPASRSAPDSVSEALLSRGPQPLVPPQVAPKLPRRRGPLLAGALAAAVFVVGAVLAYGSADRRMSQLVALGQTGVQAQRMAGAVDRAMTGQAEAFAALRDAASRLADQEPALAPALPGLAGDADALAALPAQAARVRRHAEMVLAHQADLERTARAAQAVAARLPAWMDALHALASEPAVASQAAQQNAVHQLNVLAQRIARQVRAVQGSAGIEPDAVLPLGPDLQVFQEQLIALQAALPAAGQSRLDEVAAPFAAVSAEVRVLIAQIDALREVRAAQVQLATELPSLLRDVDAATQAVRLGGPVAWLAPLLMAAAALGLALAMAALLRAQLRRQSRRAHDAEHERDLVGEQQREAQRINDANQAAIVRLMDELELVAAGDLTQQATVTEDITGAIADTINYTVEELRALVAQVQQLAGRVLATTQDIEATSTELLAASGEQLREIQQTGQSVLASADRINAASGQAQHIALVAAQSLEAADGGRQAVESTIAGMNRLRDQIQDTAKRIKRLGESSQEIGEITEMISGITDQTHVLALNAAIQAASAGEAGRGFSSVAEEVQRLAERSAEATRAIAALVKAIQQDTQGAVAAMEQSTLGVVHSAKLADAAGGALADIGGVTRELSALIAQIEADMRAEAQSANVTATHIQHIFAVTEQTSDGTRSTVRTAHDLAHMTQALRASVDRFKIS